MQAPSLLAPKSKAKKNILELPLPKGKTEVSLSAFGYLFMEVQRSVCRPFYTVTRARSCQWRARAPRPFQKLKLA
jgi:hypothetical protein